MASNPSSPRPPLGVDALLRTMQALPFWARYSRAIRVQFRLANQRRDVPHQLDTTPDGMWVLKSDAVITATPGVAWTDSLAALQSDRANANALLLFFTLREEPVNALNIL